VKFLGIKVPCDLVLDYIVTISFGYILYCFVLTCTVVVSASFEICGCVYVWVFWYEGRLISNAHSEISRKRDHVFKQTKVRSKVQYFSFKLTYLFFYIFTLSFNTFFPT
jgi:hypothetical protein